MLVVERFKRNGKSEMSWEIQVQYFCFEFVDVPLIISPTPLRVNNVEERFSGFPLG